MLGLILLIKKIERIGDQSKNIIYLAEDGRSQQRRGSRSAHRLPTDDQRDARRGCWCSRSGRRSWRLHPGTLQAFQEELTGHIRDLMHSEQPGEVVPRAILFRYWKRIVDIAGVVTTATEPLQHHGYEDGGNVDLDD